MLKYKEVSSVLQGLLNNQGRKVSFLTDLFFWKSYLLCYFL